MTTEKMVEQALRRLTEWINRSAGQHLSQFRKANHGFEPTGTEARVCDLIAKRQQLGLNKYGTTVADNPLTLRQWVTHALEEALDLSIYLARVLEELDRVDGAKR